MIYILLFIVLLIVYGRFDSFLTWSFLLFVVTMLYTTVQYLNQEEQSITSMPLYTDNIIITDEGDSYFFHSSLTPSLAESERNEDSVKHYRRRRGGVTHE